MALIVSKNCVGVICERDAGERAVPRGGFEDELHGCENDCTKVHQCVVHKNIETPHWDLLAMHVMLPHDEHSLDKRIQPPQKRKRAVRRQQQQQLGEFEPKV